MTHSEQRVYRRAGALFGAAAIVVSLSALAAAPSSGGTDRWSQPLVLDPCAAAGNPGVAFPSDQPAHRTGEGALVWARGASCARELGVRVAAIGPADRFAREQDIPGSASAASASTRSPSAAIELTGAQAGRTLLSVAGTLRELPPLSGPALTAASSAPIALATAYRGQTVALYVQRSAHGNALVLRRGPIAAGGANGVEPVELGAEDVEATAAALDYRTQAIAAWAQDAGVYARSLPGRRSLSGPIERLGSGGGDPALAALVSDDGRAIVAWMARERGRTNVYATISQPGIRFGTPRLLESYRDPDGAAPPAASLRLMRLSSGRVLIAWPGADSGRYVVRLAHVSVHGVEAPLTIALGATGDSLLEDIAPGPRGDWVALWTHANKARALYATYGGLTPSGTPLHGAAEEVSAAVLAGSARVAIDPDSDRAIAAWRTPGGALVAATRVSGGAPAGALSGG